MSYVHAEDGKFHTRYSELIRCTPGGAMRVAQERLGLVTPWEDELLIFGRTRQEMWEDESKATGRTPACFREIGVDLPVENVEREWVTEVYPGVILHSRTDCTSIENQMVIDNKSTSNKAEYFARKEQLKVYAYQMMMHDIAVNKGLILAEVWTPDRSELVGYDQFLVVWGLEEIAAMRPWIKTRVERLMVAEDLVRKTLD